MEIKKQLFDHYDKEYLLVLLEDLQSKLDKKNKQIGSLRMQLNRAKNRMNTMKDTVNYQRKKILELRS